MENFLEVFGVLKQSYCNIFLLEYILSLNVKFPH